MIVINMCDLTSTLSGRAYENFPGSTFTKRLKKIEKVFSDANIISNNHLQEYYLTTFRTLSRL